MIINLIGVVNVGWNSASILGVSLAVAGAGLYFLRSVRPELSRDYDIFFAAVGLACGGILLFNGWRLDPILQFGQFLLALSTFFFAFETLRLRGLATEQAKRSTPIVDDDRPVSRSYRAYQESDYDELEPAYREPDYPPRKRLRASDDVYDEPAPPPRRSRRAAPPSREPGANVYRDLETRSRSRRDERDDRDSRRPERSEQFSRRDRYPEDRYSEPERYSEQYDEWGEAWTEDYESDTRASRRSRPSEERRPAPEGRERRSENPRRPSSTAVYDDEEPAPYVDYVDYEPDGEEFADERDRYRSSATDESDFAAQDEDDSRYDDPVSDTEDERPSSRRRRDAYDDYDDDYDY
ncbi:MAG: hypothetical protein F6J87_04980 [Spirulina sp. SIO3F2]|nr:hypothetical protein [Spirulina sp. SIO3F2]